MSKIALVLELVRIIQANKDNLYALAMALLELFKKFQGQQDGSLVGTESTESVASVATASGLTEEQVQSLVDAA